MRYMFLIYTDESAAAEMSPQEKEKVQTAHWNLMDEAKERGVFRIAEPLQPTTSATTLQVRSGKLLVTDGPFAETKEHLAGFYLVDARDLNEAIQIASKIPPARVGSVEVRPVRELNP